jgi:serine/threonine protein phosphatase 1
MRETVHIKKAVFVVGDVHGCFYTFLKLLDHWDPKKEILVQLGDLIDSGNHSSKVLNLSQQLKTTFPKEVIFLKGNHEQMMLNYFQDQDPTNKWLEKGNGKQTLEEFKLNKVDPRVYLKWLYNLPLKWENNYFFISHAGIAASVINPLDPEAPDGVVWNRNPLERLEKVQIIGHTPLKDGRPAYDSESNSWNIDTGAYKGQALTGMKFDKEGNLVKSISIKTENSDIY